MLKVNKVVRLNDETGQVRRYLLTARAASERSTYGRVRIGACLVIGNWVVSTGWNQAKSHPLQAKYNRLTRDRKQDNHFLHAEVHALVSSGRADLTGAVAYVYREGKDGLLNCRPCPSCMEALSRAGVVKVYHTAAEEGTL